ncbi:hypothetical protein QAD02_000843 [Eretmocerus hayati]|uniref:Uncharacterized protein n=1 Tax=Eretmocerus hayati TaxID=131215 RepID=A0ACC2NET1_9HYME|nr:hypothetical protein QAD02_000843 [Eretmocerus hayati]
MSSIPRQVEPNALEDAVVTAFDNGVTHFDMNIIFGGEQFVGRGLKKILQGGVKREAIFVTDTSAPFGNRASDVEEYLKFSLMNTGLEYFDLYIFGEPWTALRDFTKKVSSMDLMLNTNGTVALDFDADHITTWKALEDQVDAGLVKSIGLMNFNERQILNLINNCKIKPSYLTIPVYLYNQEKNLRKTCAKHNIAVATWAPTGCFPALMGQVANKKCYSLPNPLEEPIVLELAKKYGKTSEQILLRHLHQEGLILEIPRLSQPEHLKEAIDIFDFQLSQDELSQLDDLDRGEDGRFIDDANLPGVAEHPEYPHPTHSCC